jgi:hypothetical protein
LIDKLSGKLTQLGRFLLGKLSKFPSKVDGDLLSAEPTEYKTRPGFSR